MKIKKVFGSFALFAYLNQAEGMVLEHPDLFFRNKPAGLIYTGSGPIGRII